MSMRRSPLVNRATTLGAPPTGRAFEEQLREINDALLVSLVRQQELAEKALAAERKLHEEERVRQRQLALTNALRVSTVGELASGLAHELNQPLVSIANLAEACTRYVRTGHPDSNKLLELLADISGQSLRAAAIVAHLRSFVSKGVSQFQLLDLVDVVRNVPHLLLRDLELARTELQLDLPSAWASTPPAPRGCSTPSSRRRPSGSAWGWPSAAPFSRPIEGGSGWSRRPTAATGW
jgi:C4-dicarboxylate-specific signal transduction histidine kinase